MRALSVSLCALFLLAGSAAASEDRPTLRELEGELICPTCETTLDHSSAPVADRMRDFIRARIAAGDTKSEIKDKLVAQFGPGVLAAPPRRGFDLLAWLLPLVGLAVGLVAASLLAWRWSTGRRAGGGDQDRERPRPALEPSLERRLDEELARFE